MQCSERGGAPVSDGTVPLVGATVVRAIFPPPVADYTLCNKRRATSVAAWLMVTPIRNGPIIEGIRYLRYSRARLESPNNSRNSM